jgi:LAO/AO transport system kinase
MRGRVVVDDQWREQLRARHVPTIARSLSALERDPAFVLSVCEELFPAPEGTASLGITGPPGAGKSTLLNGIIGEYRRRGLSVAVLAVDPSSAGSGGAVLGDRLRMQDHALDEEVYVRSLSTRGHLGGLSQSTFVAAQLLKCAGYHRVLIETVGIGQNELEIVAVADLTALVLIPGMGDQIQAIKAGVMEIGDMLVLNKSDHPGIRTLERIIGQEVHHRAQRTGRDIPLCLTNAVSGEGLVDMVAAMERLLAAEPHPERFERLRGQLLAFSRRLLEAYIDSTLQKPFLASDGYRRLAETGGTLPRPSAVIELFQRYLDARAG